MSDEGGQTESKNLLIVPESIRRGGFGFVRVRPRDGLRLVSLASKAATFAPRVLRMTNWGYVTPHLKASYSGTEYWAILYNAPLRVCEFELFEIQAPPAFFSLFWS